MPGRGILIQGRPRRAAGGGVVCSRFSGSCAAEGTAVAADDVKWARLESRWVRLEQMGTRLERTLALLESA